MPKKLKNCLTILGKHLTIIYVKYTPTKGTNIPIITLSNVSPLVNDIKMYTLFAKFSASNDKNKGIEITVVTIHTTLLSTIHLTFLYRSCLLIKYPKKKENEYTDSEYIPKTCI